MALNLLSIKNYSRLIAYLRPVSALIPRLEHQFTVSISALIQALKLLDINTSVQLIFHSSLCWLVFAFTAAVTVSTAVAVTVSRHGVNLHFGNGKSGKTLTTMLNGEICARARAASVTYAAKIVQLHRW